MRWIEVSINTPSDEIDERCQQVAEMGAEGFVIESEEDFRAFLENNRQYWDYVDKELEDKFAGLSRIKCYLTDDENGREILRRIRSRFDAETALMDDSDWANDWKQYYKPIPVGEKLLVLPEWEQSTDESRVSLRLDPGLIFGTGSHPTTRMSLQALEGFAGPGKKVLDLGCGSGILGIGSLVLGCDSCVGCDIDPKAPDVAMSNAALNGITEKTLKVYAGDIINDASLRRELGTGYDIVLANIVSDVIIGLAPHARGFMNEDAVFICSGIIDDRQAEVQAVLEKNGFSITKHLHEEEWHCFVCR